MQDVSENIEEYNPRRTCNVLTIFDDMIADMISNKKLSAIVTELFVKEKKTKYFLFSYCYNFQSYFHVPKDVRLNRT